MNFSNDLSQLATKSQDDPTLPLSREPQPQLDLLHPGYNFMTMTEKESDSMELVVTCKSITGRALYETAQIDRLEELEAAAEFIVAQLQLQRGQDRWVSLGRGPRQKSGGVGYINAYHTPEEWGELKAEERIIKLNTLVKPKASKSKA